MSDDSTHDMHMRCHCCAPSMLTSRNGWKRVPGQCVAPRSTQHRPMHGNFHLARLRSPQEMPFHSAGTPGGNGGVAIGAIGIRVITWPTPASGVRR